ncbi:MAG: polymerase polymerase protein [Candidatus Parcubacteria bacterium]|jgi:DNA polymerase-1
MTKKPTPETLVLLDAHAILHRAFHALPDFASPSGEPTGALYGVVAMLLRIIEEFKPTYIAACFDLPEPTYRHDAYADYKGTRTKTDEALVMQIKRSYDIFAAFGIPVFEVPGFEADDMLGTIAHQMKEHKAIEVVIASGDMDTLQCVDKKRVRVYTLKKGINDTILYDEAAVVERFGFPPKLVPDYKGLRGDTSDNIPGIKGIGEKTASDLIQQFGSLEAIYKVLKKDPEKLKAAGIKDRMVNLLKDGEEEAMFSKMLATIRTDAPILVDVASLRWREKLDGERISALFGEFGFRTLGARVKNIVGAVMPEAAPLTATTAVSRKQLTRLQIFLWLLESERTNASLEDIIDYGRAYLGTTDPTAIEKVLETRLKEEGTWRVYEEIEAPLVPVLAYMHEIGISLDVPYLKTLSVTMHKELAILETTIYEAAGQTFNINSPKQLGDILFDTLGLKPKQQKKTAGGQRSTKESELEKMRDMHPIINHIMRYRELQKLVSTYIDNLPTYVADDGRVHTTFIQTGAATGRMASQNPGLQNIPVRTEESRAIRQAFIASPGYTLVSIDYSQIELRVAAILSQDEKLIDIFKRGEDVHTGVAMRVFGVSAEEVTKEMRRKAKVINFGILYGMGVNALRGNLGEDTSREEAQQFFTAYFNTFTRLAEYLEDTKAAARRDGYTETLFGRRRHFPGINSGAPFIRAMAERMAINAPVQGTAADMMRVAMINIYTRLTSDKKTDTVRILLQVHDELVFEIKDEVLKEEIGVLKAEMEAVLTGYETYGVPLTAEAATGKNWGELVPYK